jgi:SAM-dependent methyltransferase
MKLMGLFAKCIQLSVRPFAHENTHLTRFLLYKSLAGVAAGAAANKVASISGSQRLCELMGFPKESILNLEYPEHDVRSLRFDTGSFDACVADQVLEHVEEEPLVVIRECARVVKPEGLVVQATVMTYPIHHGPKDLWRFTPEGLTFLFEKAGLKIACVGSWGGAGAVGLVNLGLGQLPVPRNDWHPVKRIASDPGTGWPVVVWAVGRKI